MSRPDAGFTFAETIVAVALSTVIVSLVGSVFLAQNRFYMNLLERSHAHDNAHSVAELVATDVRRATPEGILRADPDELVIRVPNTVGFVCQASSSVSDAYLPRSQVGLDTTHVSGYGVQTAAGSWSFGSGTWAELFGKSDRSVANACESVGMDTVGVPVSDFVRVDGVGKGSSPAAGPGARIMLHRELELRLASSELHPATTALYRGTWGETLLEVASGLGSQTRFAYRLQGEDAYSAPVSSGDLDRINSIRIVVHALGSDAERADTFQYEVERDVALWNSR